MSCFSFTRLLLFSRTTPRTFLFSVQVKSLLTFSRTYWTLSIQYHWAVWKITRECHNRHFLWGEVHAWLQNWIYSWWTLGNIWEALFKIAGPFQLDNYLLEIVHLQQCPQTISLVHCGSSQDLPNSWFSLSAVSWRFVCYQHWSKSGTCNQIMITQICQGVMFYVSLHSQWLYPLSVVV